MTIFLSVFYSTTCKIAHPCMTVLAFNPATIEYFRSLWALVVSDSIPAKKKRG